MPKRKRKSILLKRAPKSKLSKLKLVPEKIFDQIDLLQGYNKVLYHVHWPNSWEPLENLSGYNPYKFEKNDDETAQIESQDDADDADDDDEMWDIDGILESRFSQGKVEYLVKWKDSWIWSDELNCPHLIREFNTKAKHNLNGDNNTLERDLDVHREQTNHDTTDKRPDSTETELKIHIKDKKIDGILKFGLYSDVRMFLYQRMNGEYALIPTKIANTKYPYAVIDFYEKYLQL